MPVPHHATAPLEPALSPEHPARRKQLHRTQHKHWTPEQWSVPAQEGKVRFLDLPLPVDILHAVCDLGFSYCTPVQAEVLPRALQGGDVAAQAQTGTGKTAAFLIATFTHLMERKTESAPATPRALIIAPTRELVVQIEKDARALGKYLPFATVAVFGGMDFEKQRRQIEGRAVDIVVATPGRLLDFSSRGALDLGRTEVFVIDEADRMLDMGFIPDVKRIVRKLPPREKRRTLLFSATLSDDVMRLASQWMRDVFAVKIDPEQVTVDTVEQIVYTVRTDQKLTVLYNLLLQKHWTRVLVFANRRDRCRRLADHLTALGVRCDLLSGEVDQKKRLRILEGFKTGEIPVLVATDVAGRGIHIDDVSHVVNYELPYEAEDYVHRIGRTGRAGSSGVSVSFACEDEAFIIPEIEKFIGSPLKCVQPDVELFAPLPKPVGAARSRRSESERRGRSESPRQGGSRQRGRRSGGSSARRKA